MKAVIMNFVDCKKEIQVGDIVVILYGRGKNIRMEEKIITKIGNKYIEIGNYRNKLLFEITTGRFKSEYTPDIYLYSSKDGYQRYNDNLIATKSFSQLFNNIFSPNPIFNNIFSPNPIDKSKIEEVVKILGLENEYNEQLLKIINKDF